MAGTIVRHALYVKLGILVAAVVIGSACYLRLAAGPLNLQDYADTFGRALAARIGPGWTVTVNDTALELYGANPAVRVNGLEIRNPAGTPVIKAPYAVVSLDPLSLLIGTVSPREIELRDLQIRGAIAADGTLSFRPQEEKAPQTPAAPVAVPTSGAPASASVVSVAVGSLLRPLVQPTGLIGALDRASIVGARLSLVGPDGRDRVAFDRVSAVFERMEEGDRHIALDLDGPRGAWQLRGRVKSGPARETELEATGVPLGDVALLAGLPALPAGSNLRLNGRAAAAFADDRLSRLEGRLEAVPGTIHREKLPPIRLDQALAAAAWDEARGVLKIDAIKVESEGTRVELAGELARGGPAGWTLTLAGKDAIVVPVDTARERPFRIDTISAEALLGDRTITLERASLKGDQLDIQAVGSFVVDENAPLLRATVDIRNTEVRRMVRVWPDIMNIGLRKYLALKAGSGQVERLTLKATLDAYDIKAAFTDDPMTDASLDLDVKASGASLEVLDGVPLLRSLAIDAKASGTRARIGVRDGFIEMADGRRLGLPEASFVHTTLDKPNTPGAVAFRLNGGLDALASFLAAPALKDAGGLDIDPATVRGTVDLRVKLPLVPGKIPPISEMPLTIAGSLSDVAVDKLPGREKLEAANFTLQGESGALSVKGEGRLTGTPAIFEVRSPKPGAGELFVSAVLDEAGRSRRGLPAGPALAGPVPVKVVVDLARKAGTRVELDLQRAAIEGLVPGWSKATGKPGRMTFTLGEGETPELRDFNVDAGPVQMRGQLTLGSGGGLDRADLPVFRLSPGDDLRAQLERGPSGLLRIALKGNNGDARPILKWLSAPATRGSPARDPQEVEVELGLNILTGYNDEALIGVAGKVAARGSDVRSVQFSGRFRTAPLEAVLQKRDAGVPILSVRSSDAGSLLRFLDLYRRMIGGQLTLNARWAEAQQEGRITIDEFGLRGEPALARIVSQAVQQAGSSDERGLVPLTRSDMDQVGFTRLTTDFRKTGTRVEYIDAVIYGQQVGFNLSGWMDQARDRLDMGGTFVPAFMLNNVFSQLPVIGLVLGGGQHEGLIAVDFRVTGSIANPNLSVNPLTAVAPGILRKLFGWMMPEGAETGPDAVARGPARPRRPPERSVEAPFRVDR